MDESEDAALALRRVVDTMERGTRALRDLNDALASGVVHA